MTTPALSPSPENLYVGKGSVFFNRFDANGALTAWRHLGNASKLDLVTADEVLEKFSHMVSTTPVYKKISKNRKVTLTTTLEEYSRDNLALVLKGELDQDDTQAATPVVDEPVAMGVILGGIYRLAKLGPYTTPTFQEAAGPTALVEHTDFEWIDQTIGLIRLLETATNIADGDDLEASYTPTAYAAGEINRIIGGSVNTIEGALMFVGDPSTGPKELLEVWHVAVDPDGALPLISEDYAEFGLTMEVIDDAVNHPAAPLYQLTELP